MNAKPELTVPGCSKLMCNSKILNEISLLHEDSDKRSQKPLCKYKHPCSKTNQSNRKKMRRKSKWQRRRKTWTLWII